MENFMLFAKIAQSFQNRAPLAYTTTVSSFRMFWATVVPNSSLTINYEATNAEYIMQELMQVVENTKQNTKKQTKNQRRNNEHINSANT